MRMKLLALMMCATASFAAEGRAQDKGTLDPKPPPPLANPTDPKLPAKQVFGREMTPTEARTRSIGFYSRGCLAGAKALPVDGETWSVMRLSRNRFWGNPAMIAFLERFSRKAAKEGIWPGILVGDISQPRGGPMLTGHASHQIGLDADIWLTPRPEQPLSAASPIDSRFSICTCPTSMGWNWRGRSRPIQQSAAWSSSASVLSTSK